jgi:hypothetical protein
LSNVAGKPLTSPEYRAFFVEANRMKLCILLYPMLPANTEPSIPDDEKQKIREDGPFNFLTMSRSNA